MHAWFMCSLNGLQSDYTRRLRLGKALNFEYNEDTQTGLFQRRDPREGIFYPLFRVFHSLSCVHVITLSFCPRSRAVVLIVT